MSTPDRHPDETAFLTAIAAAPDDTTARLVFADWLEERSDPRAPWVRDADIWEWMKPDARDPVPGIMKTLTVIPRGVRYTIEREEIDWKRRGSAEAALFEMGTSAVDAVRTWIREHPDQVPGNEAQGFMRFFEPEKLQSVSALQAKLKEQSWVDVWLAVVDLGFHKAAAAPSITALTEIEGWERWPELNDSIDSVERPVENAVCHTLGQIGPAALEAVPWLASNMWLYPESAAEALIQLRADPDLIVEHINTDESYEVEAGIRSILELTDDPVAFLIRNAQRHTGRVAYMSLSLLAEMGPKASAALPALQDFVDNRTEWDADYVRDAANRAIQAINSKN
ncbi:TIGR02996 domain-containing protein [Gemmata sp. G18]|uniref:TIGR02996 domain-containing protein n=1 Tax=Gemmata palustris TaxID=2822762 RepID=A0ABS5BTF6_9BACT|nr:TIGR02996 domain-containing protein [Gemmata palustris]MBP3957009.1 TIGR02996 domain-containing protein [Gemmata palustris]